MTRKKELKQHLLLKAFPQLRIISNEKFIQYQYACTDCRLKPNGSRVILDANLAPSQCILIKEGKRNPDSRRSEASGESHQDSWLGWRIDWNSFKPPSIFQTKATLPVTTALNASALHGSIQVRSRDIINWQSGCGTVRSWRTHRPGNLAKNPALIVPLPLLLQIVFEIRLVESLQI